MNSIPEKLADLVSNERVHCIILEQTLEALRLSRRAKYGPTSDTDWLEDVPITTRRDARVQSAKKAAELKQKVTVSVESRARSEVCAASRRHILLGATRELNEWHSLYPGAHGPVEKNERLFVCHT